MSTVLKNARKIDRLSQLPPELLEDIFDLAAYSYELCAVPLSKSLRLFHDKALYRYLRFETFPQFQRFIKTFDKHRAKVTSLAKGSLIINFHDERATFPVLERIVSALSPSQLEFGSRNGISPAVLLLQASSKAHYSNLQVCSLFGNHSNMVVATMRGFSSLRMVKLSEVSFAADASMAKAPQVTQIDYTSFRTQRGLPFTSPISILPFFPSAAIVQLDLVCFHESEYESLRSILTQLTPALRKLRLEVCLRGGYVSSEPIDDVLPLFPFLRELHLDDKLLSDDIHKHLLALHHLVELSLVLENLYPELVHLLRGPQRLRHLQKLSLEFVPLEPGEYLDIDYAVCERRDAHCDEDGNGVMLLDHCESISDMYYWKLPFGDDFEEGMELAMKVEKMAREADIVVSTNIDNVRQGFRRHLVEFFSRGIGHYYFDGSTWRIEEAQAMAKSYQLNLPTLEIDSKDELETEHLEWFKVKMKDVEIDGGKKCYALNLRRKKK